LTRTPVLSVYSRRGCHLCEDLLGELEPLLRGRAAIEVHDIDADPALRERYHARVPVVVGSGRELCEYRLDRAAILAWLGGTAGVC
jgi:hypothetical protein